MRETRPDSLLALQGGRNVPRKMKPSAGYFVFQWVICEAASIQNKGNVFTCCFIKLNSWSTRTFGIYPLKNEITYAGYHIF